MPDLSERVIDIAFIAIIIMTIVVAIVGIFMGPNFLPPPAGCTNGDKRVVVHIDGLDLIGLAAFTLALALSWYIFAAILRS